MSKIQVAGVFSYLLRSITNTHRPLISINLPAFEFRWGTRSFDGDSESAQIVPILTLRPQCVACLPTCTSSSCSPLIKGASALFLSHKHQSSSSIKGRQSSTPKTTNLKTLSGPTSTVARKRVEYCFESTVLEKRTHWASLSSTTNSVSSVKNSVRSLWHANNRLRWAHWALSLELSEGQKPYWARCLKPYSPKPYPARFREAVIL